MTLKDFPTCLKGGEPDRGREGGNLCKRFIILQKKDGGPSIGREERGSMRGGREEEEEGDGGGSRSSDSSAQKGRVTV